MEEPKNSQDDLKFWWLLITTEFTHCFSLQLKQLKYYCNKFIHVIDYTYLKFPIKSIIFAGNSEVSKKDKNDNLMTEVADLQAQLKASELEKEQLKVSCRDDLWQDNEHNYSQLEEPI